MNEETIQEAKRHNPHHIGKTSISFDDEQDANAFMLWCLSKSINVKKSAKWRGYIVAYWIISFDE